MYEAERIPKRGRAPREMGGYPFVQVGDAADFIRKALAEKVLTMMPTAVQVVGQQDRPTAKGGSMTTVDLITDWTITDGESGESITIQSFGAGADVGDKYSGKASTSAMKYALLTGFLLSTGEDSELGDGERPRGPAMAHSASDGVEADADSGQTTTNGKETEELLGKLTKTGTVRKGTSSRYQLEPHETLDGTHAIGFRLEVDGDRAIPQVLVDGAAGEALYLGTAGKPQELVGHRMTVKGRLFNVKAEGRRSYYRLKEVVEFATSDLRYPADEPEPIEAETAPLFDEDEQKAIDAAVVGAP
jgi:hypothetical protein